MKYHLKKTVLISLILFLFLTTGCGRKEGEITGTMDANENTDEKIAVASWQGVEMEWHLGYKMIGDTLYYMDAKWDIDSESYTEASVFRKEWEEQEAVEVASFAEKRLITFFIGPSEELYYFYADAGEDTENFYLQKTDKEGKIIYNVPVSEQNVDGVQELQNLGKVTMGAADSEGEVCLANPLGELFLFDGSGQFAGSGSAKWDEDYYHDAECGLVNAGENGIFTYIKNDGNVILQQIAMSSGELGESKEISLHSGSWAVVEIFSGYDNGIFLSDGDALWNYDVAKDVLVKALEWGQNTVNLKGYIIDAVGALPEDKLYIMAYQSGTDTVFVQIDYQEKDAIQAKQTITLGTVGGDTIENSELEEMANAFNRKSQEYQIEFCSYDSVLDLQLELLKGEDPDILCLGNLDVSNLASKGVLENLSPYFAKSGVVKEEDLLPSILRGGYVNEELLCVLPAFQINGILVEKGTSDGEGWTPDEFLALGEAHVDASLILCTNYEYYYSDILQLAIQADLGNYVDWKEKECFFDDGKFAALLSRVKNLEMSKSGFVNVEEIVASGERFTDVYKDKFYKGEVLTYEVTCSAIGTFQEILKEIGENSELTGYPNNQGKIYFDLYSITPLGMNSASENKAGVWAFMEFLLSEEYQNRQNSFPVREDSFEKYVNLKELYGGNVVNDLSEAERDLLRYMVDNAYWSGANQSSAVLSIVYEEADAVFAGDKTPEEAADIIQNRVTLFLNE